MNETEFDSSLKTQLLIPYFYLAVMTKAITLTKIYKIDRSLKNYVDIDRKYLIIMFKQKSCPISFWFLG